MSNTSIISPFCGELPASKIAIRHELHLSNIAQQPVQKAEIFHHQKIDDNYVIEAGEGKYYGLVFFHYCTKYGVDHRKKDSVVFLITLPMVIEALLYYGRPLWNDTSQEHPAIEPFRRFLDGEEVTVKLTYKPNR